MEFKVRRESQTMMEKTFHHWAGRKGIVRSGVVLQMMKQMQPDWSFTSEELDNVIAENDKNGSGNIDLEGFNKIALHFLLKQAKQDFDGFIHKHEIGPKDFSE